MEIPFKNFLKMIQKKKNFFIIFSINIIKILIIIRVLLGFYKHLPNLLIHFKNDIATIEL